MSQPPVICSICGRSSEHYKAMAFLRSRHDTLCGSCVKDAAAKVAEIEGRLLAARSLEIRRDASTASMRDLVSGMAGSVRRDPQEWWTDGYRLYHGNGVQVWIANGRRYVKITIPERGEFAIPWRQRLKLWRAVASWRGRPLPDFWRYNPCRPEEPEHRS